MMRAIIAAAMSMAAASVLYAVAPIRATTPSQREFVIDVVNKPRPVSEAVLQLQKQLGYVVTYEDTIYRFPGDIVDVAKQVRRDGKDIPVLVMRGGTIRLRHTPRASTIAGQAEELLQEIVTRSRQAGNIGDFQVEPAVNGYHVVPVQARTVKGVEERYESPLESRITMEPRDESAYEMVSRFVDVVSKASGQPVEPGLMPPRLHTIGVTVDARNDKARDVLWRALQSINPTLSWQLLCVPVKPCALNIHPVSLEK